MVPVVSLMAMWGYATVTTAGTISDQDQLRQADTTLLSPAAGFVAAVQTERSAAARSLAAPADPGLRNAFRQSQSVTDSSAAALRSGINDVGTDVGSLAPGLSPRVEALLADANGLQGLRQALDPHGTGWEGAYAAYGKLVDDAFSVEGALTGVQDKAASGDARVLLELSRGRELLARQDAVLGAARAAGRMTQSQQTEFAGAVYAQRLLFTSGEQDLTGADKAAYDRVVSGPDYSALQASQDAVVRAGNGTAPVTAVPAAQWNAASGTVLKGLRDAELTATAANEPPTGASGLGALGGSGLAVVLGLAGVLLSLLISVKIGRGLVVALVDLRDSALRLAARELPDTMRRLHAGETVDVDAIAPEQDFGDDEMGQVGNAMNAVHRAALTAAAERAEALSGISGAYVKLARRSQVLLHRQLSLLDTMERRNDDPSELEDLFRLDHLTTRMRRHAESLIILSGAAPGRGWRNPVPLLDVVRSAVSEVEDFPRVDVTAIPETHLTGAAVADLTHLLAELVENATAFSPPHTRVQLRGQQVGSGVVVEIEDRGLGMGDDALVEANDRIADVGRIDLLDTEQLGLFVVNRLAHRHGVSVSLQRSAYGGVTAVVLLPAALLEDEPVQEEPAEQAEAEAVAVGGTHAEVGMFDERPARRRAADRDHAAAQDRAGRFPAPRRAPDNDPLRSAQARGARAQGGAAGAGESETASRPGGLIPFPDAERGPRVRRDGNDPARGDAEGGRGHDNGSARDDGAPEPLPRRTRQASLAVPLRNRPDTPPRFVQRDHTPGPSRRSPEQARATMASLRAGWARGRGTGVPQPPAASQEEHESSEIPPRGDDAR